MRLSTNLRGAIPVAPTIFRDDEELDLDGQSRVVDYLVDGDADAVCILANYSEQFSLTDSERDQIIDATVARAHGRLPVVVAVNHFSARVANQRSLAAQERGAAMVMLMPPFYGAAMSVDDAHIVEFFLRVADGLEIDIMIQDSPLSTTTLSIDVLTKLAKSIPQVRYVKIERPRTAEKLRQLIGATGDALPGAFDGEEGITLIPDLDAGAQGTMCSCSVPDVLGDVVRTFHSGDRGRAVAVWEGVLPLIHFENRQCGLNTAKILMKEGGIIASDRVRAPIGDPPEATKRELMELSKRFDPLVLRWGVG